VNHSHTTSQLNTLMKHVEFFEFFEFSRQRQVAVALPRAPARHRELQPVVQPALAIQAPGNLARP
jgi:hypothetical protein